MSGGDLDQAIKFGAGRYIQGRNVLEKCGEEIAKFAKRVYIIAGKRALAAVEEKFFDSLRKAEIDYEVEIFESPCSYEAAKESSEKCLCGGYEEIVGIGGGKIMDFAKAVAETAGIGVINIPTSIATCAAFTTMSVMYTLDGAYYNNFRYEHEVDAVLVDLDVIVNCPYKYAAAGILDAMAKKIEIQNGKSFLSCYDTRFDLYTAFRISEYTYEMLEQYGMQAVDDIKNKKITEAVEYITFINIAVTGVLSNITKGFQQSALAHMFYYGVRTHFTKRAENALHGEIVAVGLFIQLCYNQMTAEKKRLFEFMKSLNMPISLGELGIEETERNLNIIEEYLKNSIYVERKEEKFELLHKAVLDIK